MDTSILRQIPKMDALLELDAVKNAARELPRPLVKQAVQTVLDELRARLRAGEALPAPEELETRLVRAIASAGAWRLRRVVNATGVVLHTNLGRAPLAPPAAERVGQTAAGYTSLEYDLETARRGSRHALIERQLCRLTGAEAAMVVNNNAAAVFLMLYTLARGKKVAVSRGELVEIGGSFRVPEIMSASGAELLEIGTTNKTHRHDYVSALQRGDIGAILKVHTSNFKIVGFSEDVPLCELSDLSKEAGVPLLYDLGAGFLVRPEQLGLHEGVYIPDAVRYADVCCFSGDKLLGSAQAGILLGRAPLIAQMKACQLSRMLRVDKMTLAALEATLRLYAQPETAVQKIPVLRMLSAPQAELKDRALALCEKLGRLSSPLTFAACECLDEPGGGALPGLSLPGWAVEVCLPGCAPQELEKRLRAMPVPIIGRIAKGRLLLCVRTLLPEDEAALLDAFAAFEAAP